MDSLCTQTDKNFSVLVGDDAGPNEIKLICESFSTKLNLRYVRFSENLGGRDLAAQWNRCLELVADEWVLMPGDDDTLHPECIQHFRSAVLESEGRHAAYRATLRGIDEFDREQYIYPPIEHENSVQRLMALANPDYHGMVIEYLFSKSRLQSIGGFISFPLGWYSDTATWILLATRGGVLGVPCAVTNHRMSGRNLSASNPALIKKKLYATLKFLAWVDSNQQEIGIEFFDWVELRTGLLWRLRATIVRTNLLVFCFMFPKTVTSIANLEKKPIFFEVLRTLRLFIQVRVV